MDPTARLTDIRKTYGSREVLHGVDLDVYPGEIHALLGANGSGKSTLVKVLTGSEQPSGGAITVPTGGQRVLRSPKDAREHGIRVVHQETPFIDTMSVAENIALKLGYQTGSVGIHWHKVRRFANDCLAPLDLDIDTSRLAATLTASERGLIAMAMALGDGGRSGAGSLALVLDEATASIPEDEAESVLRRVRALADTGVAVLMVTHRTREVRQFADRVSVLHDGHRSYTGSEPINEDHMVRLIIGKSGEQAATESSDTAASTPAAYGSDRERKPLLEVRGLRAGPIDDVSFSIARGEILGVVGGPASGIDVVASALAGLERKARGSVEMAGESRALPRSPRESLAIGITLVPRDRLRQGAVGTLSIFENAVLPSARGLRYATGTRRRMVHDMMERLDIRPRDPRALVRELSGGNQQKVIVGKWMARDPRVLILDDPTVGIDPGARSVLFKAVRAACKERGLAVLLLSSEPEQLSQHCDRVIAIHRGIVAETLAGDDLTELRVARWATA